MKYRKRRDHRNQKSQRKLAITITICLICILAVSYAAFSTTLNVKVYGNIKIDDECVEGKVWEFEQENEIQEFSVPCSGEYKLETWGASGGDNIEANDQSIGGYGGYGGYSVGNIDLKLKQKIYITIGSTADVVYFNNYSYTKGYNGGGLGGPGGGGATSITNVNRGELYHFENYISEILIVSGGGGGDDAIGMGGCGGGFKGCKSKITRTGITQPELRLADGGNQSSGGEGYENGSFGKGGGFLEYSQSHSDLGGAGGGGFYGGGSGKHPAWSSGGGGSGYIGNTLLTDKAMYCYGCEESLDLTKPEIFTISTIGETNYIDILNCPNGYDENPVSKCAKDGDGYAKITLITRKPN